MDRVADWHGEMAAKSYSHYLKTGEEWALRDYCRYASIADRLWASK